MPRGHAVSWNVPTRQLGSFVRHREIDLWAVLVGELASEADAEAQAATMLKLHHEIKGAFVVRVDETASLVAY